MKLGLLQLGAQEWKQMPYSGPTLRNICWGIYYRYSNKGNQRLTGCTEILYLKKIKCLAFVHVLWRCFPFPLANLFVFWTTTSIHWELESNLRKMKTAFGFNQMGIFHFLTKCKCYRRCKWNWYCKIGMMPLVKPQIPIFFCVRNRTALSIGQILSIADRSPIWTMAVKGNNDYLLLIQRLARAGCHTPRQKAQPETSD